MASASPSLCRDQRDDPAVLDRCVSDCRDILAVLPGAGALHVAADLAEITARFGRSARQGSGFWARSTAPPAPSLRREDTVVPPENLPAFLTNSLRSRPSNGLGFGIMAMSTWVARISARR